MRGFFEFLVFLFTGRRHVSTGEDQPRARVPEPKRKPTAAARPSAPVEIKPTADSGPLPETPATTPVSPIDPIAPADPAAYLATLVRQDASPLGPADFDSAAALLNCESAAVEAVAMVESGPLGAFDAQSGLPIILFEPHIFSRLTKRAFDASNPRVSYRSWNPRAYPRLQAERWEQMREAFLLDDDAALQSASYGRFQIMGFNFGPCGYADVFQYVSDISRSESRQLASFVSFIKADRRLLNAIQKKDWRSFALAYNGEGALAEGHRYDLRIANAYDQAKARRGVA